MNTRDYYKGKHSLYFHSNRIKLNSYEFDLIKRLTRTKGEKDSDLAKSIDVLNIYKNEYTQGMYETFKYDIDAAKYCARDKAFNEVETMLLHKVCQLRHGTYNTFLRNVEELKEDIAAIRDLIMPSFKTLRELLTFVSEKTGIEEDSLCGTLRLEGINAARAVFAIRAYELGWPMADIGIALNRSHSTVSVSYLSRKDEKKIKEYYKKVFCHEYVR